MIFLHYIKYPANQQSVTGDENVMEPCIPKLPAILPRSGMGFYLLDLFQVNKKLKLLKTLIKLRFTMTICHTSNINLSDLRTDLCDYFVAIHTHHKN